MFFGVAFEEHPELDPVHAGVTGQPDDRDEPDHQDQDDGGDQRLPGQIDDPDQGSATLTKTVPWVPSDRCRRITSPPFD